MALSWHLVQLADAQDQASRSGQDINAASSDLLPKSLRDFVTAGLMHIDSAGNVQVFVHTKETSTASVAPVLISLGARIEIVASEHDIIQAWVPIRRLRSAAAAIGVRQVRLPDYGVTQAGSVTTEGDSLLNAAEARSTFGIDGSGVRVGVISDGVAGLAASQASGDLPAVDTATCNTFGGDPGAPTLSGAPRPEGTAMLEIVHDLAPGAELWFGHYGFARGGTVLDFNAAVNCLASNVDVVVDDIAWFNVGPYDGTSIVSANTAATLSSAGPIRGYYNAVGNYALKHYQEAYSTNVVATSHIFGATSTTVDRWGFGGRQSNPVYVLAGDTLVVRLQWDDPFGGSCNDYDLLLTAHNSLATGLYVSVNPQTCTQDPTELGVYSNNTGADRYVDIVIFPSFFNPNPSPDVTFEIFFDGGEPNFLTACSSVPNNSDADGGVVSLGAINASDPGIDDYAFYSSCGPTNDGRTKPDAAAIDEVSVTGNGGFNVPFRGTSAAAPHAAAIAALLLDCNPDLTRSQFRDALLNSAVDLGAPGPDNRFGYGRLDAVGAANAAGCAEATATPTATPTPSPTSPPSTAIPSATPPSPPTATAIPTATPPILPTATAVPTATQPSVGGIDLVLIGMSTTPSQPQVGELIQVHLQVSNTGTEPAGPFRVEFYQDSPGPPGPGDVSTFACAAGGLSAGGIITCNGFISYNTAGSHTAWVLVDANGQVAESNETNNISGPLNITVSGPPPTATPPSNLLGDPSCNGIINSIDALFILQFLAGLTGLCSEANADVNQDLLVDAIDATILLQFLAGLIGSLPP